MTSVRLVIGAAVVAILIAVAVFFVRRYRDDAVSRTADLNTHLSTFEQMRLQGDLDDEEYRRVKGTLRELTEQHFAEQIGEENRNDQAE